MDLRDKLIKSLEELIKLQKELIEQKEARIRTLELEKSSKQWYPIQDPHKSPSTFPPGVFYTTSNDIKTENWGEVPYSLESTGLFQITEPDNEKKEQTQEGSGT